MCGIVGYIGKREALPIIISSLEALEYRGYDSAGLVICRAHKKPFFKRKVGYVEELKKSVSVQKIYGSVGLGHTRWATHGEPSVKNAHPHYDCQRRIFIVHNGIIENYKEIKKRLQRKGHIFSSQTDSEVVAHLIEEIIKKEKNFKTSVLKALEIIKGAYALAIVDSARPEKIYAASLSSPLIIGIGKQENFLASDSAALVGSVKKIIHLKDGRVAEITQNKVTITDMSAKEMPLKIERLEWGIEQAQKGKFPHFMLKEIFEGPEVVKNSLSGRLKPQEYIIKLGGLELIEKKLKRVRRLIIVACGTSFFAGLVGEYLFEEIAGLPTEVHFASEFRYRKEPFDKDTALLAISQSGETADTIEALRKAKKEKLLTLGLVNVVGSTIARETHAGVYNHAGPEIGVASTKAFLSQLAILNLMALYMSRKKEKLHKELMKELNKIPDKMKIILKRAREIERLAKKYKNYKNFLFLGRRYSYPVALEGALKLKEISYIHAEGYGAGEMKHGPIAMIDKNFPTIAVVPKNSVSEKMYSNIEEIKARGGKVIAIATEGDKTISALADNVFYIPKTLEPLEPLLAVIPLQLFAYYIGTKLGYNVDKPRNLAKSVTVE